MYALEVLARLNKEAIEGHLREQEGRLRAMVRELVRQELTRQAAAEDGDGYGDAGC